MSSTISRLVSPRNAIRARVNHLRQARARHQSLAHDLAGYTSDNDFNDLSAVLDRYDDSETRDIRRILAGQRTS